MTSNRYYGQHRGALIQEIKDDFVRQAIEAGRTENNAREAIERSALPDNVQGRLRKAWNTYRSRNDNLAAAEKNFQDLAQRVNDAHSKFIEKFEKRSSRQRALRLLKTLSHCRQARGLLAAALLPFGPRE
jgi:hypothetical protein